MNNYKKIFDSFAICINNIDYPASLELHKVYPVLPDIEALEDGDLRIIDESGEDYLYPSDYFLVVNLAYNTEAMLADSFSRTYNMERVSVGRVGVIH